MRRWTVQLTCDDWRSDPQAEEVCRVLLNGELVAIPTETVYGLAADATNSFACARIFAAKGRPQFNPLISHVASLEAAMVHGAFNADARKLAEAFWPGPLTLVVPKSSSSPICDLATAGLETVALRVPAGPVMRFLSERTGRPLAAPSANISGRISATRAEEVIEDLAEALSFVVDAGPCSVGIESTIISCIDDTPRLLRPGGIPREAIEHLLGKPLQSPEAREAPAAPGMLSSHYAPSTPVRLNASEVRPGEALLSFGGNRLANAGNAIAEINLSETADLTEAAACLFSALRRLDANAPTAICVQNIPSDGLGEAINDRLRRAAAPRS
jgi:L-threonylcarbamoyladenylate synthase